MRLTKNFNLKEFECKDSSGFPNFTLGNIRELAENLQVIRDYIGQPLHVNSAYRSPEWNKYVGGVRNSQHIKGKASDLTSKNYTSKQLYKIIRHLIHIGKIRQGGLGLYNGFVHYDIRGVKARWNKSKYYIFK